MSVEELQPVPDDSEFAATVRGFAPGQKLFNRYTLIRMIGRGGMGMVWLARDEELGEEIALKFLPEMVHLDATALEELKRETRRSRKLAHPNIVKVYDFISDGSAAAISMEFVNGGTLSGLRAKQEHLCFEVREIEPWIRQLLNALTYAHEEARVVHRDLKPANIMVDIGGHVKVADFGVASSISENMSRVTIQRGSSGTLVYMSPQQAMGNTPSVQDDIYAFGATLYELVAGKPPFYRGDILSQLWETVPSSMTQRRAELEIAGEPIPGEWEQTVAACLAKEPAQRPQSIAEVSERLGFTTARVTLLAAPEVEITEPTVEVAAPEPLPPEPLPPKPSGKGWLIGAGVGVAVLILGGLGYYFGIALPAKKAKEAQLAQTEIPATVTTTPKASPPVPLATPPPSSSPASVPAVSAPPAAENATPPASSDASSGVMVTTLAGNASQAEYRDGPGKTALFDFPAGVAVDSHGNVYVSDARSTCVIRKIAPDGVVTTLAGSPKQPGSADGTGSAARFNLPYGIAVDSSGNVYVADYANDTIRKITPDAVVTTLAGSAGNKGGADGTGNAARFNQPNGLAVDGSGNVYVADTGNNTIRKVTPDGVVTTFAGTVGVMGGNDGSGSAAQFNQPMSVAVDSGGNVYVADDGNDTIRKITANGVVTTLAGALTYAGSSDGTGSAAHFQGPRGIALDRNGNLYVADSANFTIRKITPDGVVTTLAGSAGQLGSKDGPGREARFSWPQGVAVDGDGNVFVADGNPIIRKITQGPAPSPSPTQNPATTPSAGDASSGVVVTTFAGSPSHGASKDGLGSAAQFSIPSGVAVDGSGNVYVTDTPGPSIRKITPEGLVTTLAGGPGNKGTNDGRGSAAQFSTPRGVAVDGSGNLYVADQDNDTIRKITPDGMVTTVAGLAGSPGSTDGLGNLARFNKPYGVALDGSGNLYVTDQDNSTIRKITPDGMVTTVAGSAGIRDGEDGPGSLARFSGPAGVAVDRNGNVYVADKRQFTIRKITPDGMVTTVAGLAEHPGSNDGLGSAARFRDPVGLAVDGGGNIYVVDRDNSTIRKITPDGVVTTVAGSTGSNGSVDGTGTAARFSLPTDVAVDARGNLYVTDSSNYTIRKITQGAAVAAPAGGVQAPVSMPGGATSATVDATPSAGVPQAGQPWVNSLGVKFVPAGTDGVLFSVWDVRVKDYEIFARETGLNWTKPNFVKSENEPVGVSWHDAKEFCDWLTKKEQAEGKLASNQSYRLPTDAEWSKAAGLNETSEGTPAEKPVIKGVYPWGTQWPPPAGAGNFFGEENVDGSGKQIAGYRDGYLGASPVGIYTPNNYGLYDMAGNVWQWCEDKWDPATTERVLRGSTFYDFSAFATLSSTRHHAEPVKVTSGFRVVLVISAAPTASVAPTSLVAAPPEATNATTAPAQTSSVPASVNPDATPSAGVPQAGQPWGNSLGVKFVPAGTNGVLFSVWDVRVKDYELFARETGLNWTKPSFVQSEDEPVITSWNDAKEFCDWLTKKEQTEGKLASNQSYRLPTDAEWSRAVGLNESSEGAPAEKPVTKGVYPWGTQWPPPAGAGNLAGEDGGADGSGKQIAGYRDGYVRASPVGSFTPNNYGLYDMAGNARQWCEDKWDPASTERVLRGSDFYAYEQYALFSSIRHHAEPVKVNYGFRVVLAISTNLSATASPPVATPPAVTSQPAITKTDTQPVAQSLANTSVKISAGVPLAGQPWVNSLGVKFVPAGTDGVLFSVWDVRVKDYGLFVKETGHEWDQSAFPQTKNDPAVRVSWEDAHAFCDWLTKKERAEGKLGPNQVYRLPTDAEWSKAAGLNENIEGTPEEKGGKIQEVYPWGTQWPPPVGAGNYHGEENGESYTIKGYRDDYIHTSPVGSFTVNPYGLYDMGGNVAQWCEDKYNTVTGTRVLRGGDWFNYLPESLSSSSRRQEEPTSHDDSCGFRVVLVVSP